MKTELDAILDVLEKAQARIDELQSTVLQQQAMINAVLLCLRDRTQSDPKELEKLFMYYQKVVLEELAKTNKGKKSILQTEPEKDPGQSYTE